MAGNIGIRINIDTGQAKGQVESLSRTITDLNKQLEAASEAKDWKSVAQLTQKINDTSSARSSAMGMAQAQGGITGQNINIDTSQAIRRIEELDNALLTFNRHLENAKGEMDFRSTAQLEKVIEGASIARTKAMEYGGVQEKPDAESLIKEAEATGDWKSAAASLSQGGRYQAAPEKIDIDTSQAVSSMQELETAIAEYQKALREAREGNNDWMVHDEQLDKIIRETESARSQVAELARQAQGGTGQNISQSIGQAQTPDDLMRRAETTGDFKPAAYSYANNIQKQSQQLNLATANPQTNQLLQSGLLRPGDIKKRVIIDASQAKAQVDELNKTIETLNQELEKATEDRDWRSVAHLTQAIDNASSARGNLINQARQAQSAQPQPKEGMLGGMGLWVLQQSLSQITHGIISVWDASLSAAKQRASGDYTGAAVSQKRAKEETIGQAVGMGLGALGFLGGPVLGMMTTALGGELGRFIGGIGAKKMEENLAYSSQYKSAFQGMDSLNQLYGGAINKKSSDENSNYGLELRGRAVTAARGTGLDTEDFIEALKQSGGYGIKSETQAMNMLHTQALWSRFTGADLGTIQKIAGQAYRFNGETNTTSTAYGGLMAQNMGKGQMPEFLTAMGRIMEESISKGFIKGSEEIAGNMQMLYKLSGGSALWQGEQGAQRYSQMSMAISSATNLQSVEDVISYGAARDLLAADTTAEREAKFRRLTGGAGKGNVYTDTYVDAMQILERGLSAELLKGQWSAVRQLDGDNTAATIERFKTMYGLNYTGASQVWGMYQNAWDQSLNGGKGDWKEGFNAKEYETQVKKLQESPDFQSDSQKLQDILNDLKQKGIQIGQIEFFKTELPALREAMKSLEDALGLRTGEKPPDPIPGVSEEVLREHTNRSLPVSHSMIFNDAAIKPGTTGLDAYNQIKERYFSIIDGKDERQFLSEIPAMGMLAEFIPRAIADGEFSTTGRNSDFAHAEYLLGKLEEGITKLLGGFRDLTTSAETIQRDGIPLTGEINMEL